VDENGLPPPGTLDDLLADAAAVGWPTNERALREWTRLGLLGSPTRRSLGRGHGQAPALYSRQQRALFRELARLRADGARSDQLAKIVVYGWLDLDDAWVSTEQAIAATTTAIGNPRKSIRVATQAAKQLVQALPIPAQPSKARTKLIAELSRQLNRGHVDPRTLRPAASAVLDAGEITVIRGPAGARIGTDALVGALVERAKGAARIAKVTTDEMDEVRLHHRISRAQYRFARPNLEEAAEPETRHLFAPETDGQLVNGAVPTVLFLLGVLPAYRARTKIPR
jgi:hypothetical protein